MTLNEFKILLVLEKAENYGLGIVKCLEKELDDLSLGSVYNTLNAMEKKNLIEKTRYEDRRQYYQITPEGTQALDFEKSCLVGLMQFEKK